MDISSFNVINNWFDSESFKYVAWVLLTVGTIFLFKKIKFTFKIVIAIALILVILAQPISSSILGKASSAADDFIKRVSLEYNIDITEDVVDKILKARDEGNEELNEVVASTPNDESRLYSVYFQVVDGKLKFYIKKNEVYVPLG